ncbi:MAG: hypothetical protein ACLURP_01680 [Ruminococcus sp.]
MREPCFGRKPREIGTKLKEQHHGMFLSMPVPMQIYAGTDSALTCPLYRK